jgi:hypothetical protein
VPGGDIVQARQRALELFAKRASKSTYSLFLQRFGRPWTPVTEDKTRLVLLNTARNGFKL